MVVIPYAVASARLSYETTETETTLLLLPIFLVFSNNFFELLKCKYQLHVLHFKKGDTLEKFFVRLPKSVHMQLDICFKV